MRADPSRLGGLRRAMLADVRRRFARLRGVVYQFMATDPLGLAANERHRYACVMLTCAKLQQMVRDVQDKLDPADVLKLPGTPHVTARYGLHAITPGVLQYVGSEHPTFARVGALSVFRNADADVLKFDVESWALTQLHESLGLFPHTDTHATYKAHATVAYMRPGTAPANVEGVHGWQDVLLDTAIVSDADDVETLLALNESYFSYCPREGGRCIASDAAAALKAVGAKAAHVEHVAKAWAADVAGKAVELLPHALQPAVHKTFALARAGTSAAFATWTAGQVLAERVAKERGATDEQARRLRGVLSTVDLATFKPLSIGLAATGISHATLGMASLVPPATATYLAYSTARDPAATYRAAKGLVKDGAARGRQVFDRVRARLTRNDGDNATKLADAVAAHDYDDWYIALLTAALEAEVPDPIGLADSLYAEPTANRWTFASDPEKLRQFQDWLNTQTELIVTGKSPEEVWQRYVEAGYKKGAGRAVDDAVSKLPEGSDREEFLRTSFGGRVSQDKVKLMASRTFSDLENVTDDMATKMTRVLTDGLTQGQSPLDVARALRDEVDFAESRAETVARTELMRVHSEGQLDALDELGVDEVGAAVEWQGTEGMCHLCEALDGVVLTVDEARGLLPRHPNCRCAWIPALDGGDDYRTTREKLDDGGYDDIEIARKRPTGVLNKFCATGPGGGVDPHCGREDGVQLSVKAQRAKDAHVMVDKDIQRYAEEHNEPKFAKAMGGSSLPDNEPIDVRVGTHGIELKTMVVNGNRKITMKRSAMDRKAEWERKNGVFHTVVFDDHQVKDAKGPGKHDESKRVMYYRRGYGSFRVDGMHQVKDLAELKQLMDTPNRKLPPAAQRPAGQRGK